MTFQFRTRTKKKKGSSTRTIIEILEIGY